MKTIEIDLETRSDRDITKCGVYAYADSPYFAITLMSVAVDDGAVQLADAEKQIAEFTELTILVPTMR